ncbi:PREDICTED: PLASMODESMATA CALLOSE-BINDING PROTEIN 5-like [Camelina sativa]|uniref:PLASMODESMATA CALLOSE-BINDING PROTEIN 5-like n=1 Tax=Camelina sativa TaxID=90675 RepID=A0ABM0YUH2_CAMSA|nr:PREDICTED: PLASMODESMATA CALLOSE-BINDING PROTEIN 5-like [Camelina sativa]XP_010506060.1 PREDICTED: PLASMODESMATA CALLOSE-BINDING PROTEIN 5-like [Camelina sativa]XP_010506061.1 PREDICTED: PLASMODESMATA CALLOSE-BINDING PROTEIN 5-like [Camelina sativa]
MICLVLSVLITAAAVAAAAEFGGEVLETELWCVAKNNAEDSALQTAVDWACGPGGADCGEIQEGGFCYDPSDMVKMASYVFNNYYLKNGLADEACNFTNNAAVTSLNPSQGACKFPSSKRVSSGSIADATSTQATTAAQESSDFSRARRMFTSWSFPFIILGHIMTMTLIIHPL